MSAEAPAPPVRSAAAPAPGGAALRRLLHPQRIAVVGGAEAAEVIRQCRRMGYGGTIWPVHPRHATVEGLPACARIEDLPGAPDAAFVAVPRGAAVEVVAALQAKGAGAALCYASGFAEVGGEGVELQRRLVEAAGDMALIGPNCYGLLNYLDACALWPDHFGGGRVERGVALLAQSGNIALNLTMQRHHLPIAYVLSLGNQAQTGITEALRALLDDPRVTAIGLYLEGLERIAPFAEAALQARRRGVPVVALKAGSSAIGAQLAASHTRSLAGSDALYAALFERCGVARVEDLDELLETLKLLHVCGVPRGDRLASLSCSGGDAALVADLGHARGLRFPPPSPPVTRALAEALGPQVAIHNPLDYQTYIWGDQPALQRCFAPMLGGDYDLTLLVLDFPHGEQERTPGWDEVLDAYLAAHAERGGTAALVSSMAELMPATVAQRLIAAGIAPLQGLRNALVAIAAGVRMGRARAEASTPHGARALRTGVAVSVDEASAKALLQRAGVGVPPGRVVAGADQAVQAADAIGYPVVVKGVDAAVAHKSEMGAVKLGLAGAQAVRRACAELQERFPRLLVESMVGEVLLELLVGVTRDEQFGLALTLGAGGILVERLGDSVTLLLPATRGELEAGLRRLRCFDLLEGFRGRPRADLARVLDALEAACAFALAHEDRLLELEINPLVVTAREALAVDALIRWVDAPADAA